MDASEFETLVTELETRVDRLRSLYEQYFMGIEKTIPSVPLKDVERRIQALRRDQPRNTGLRFRFQMIIQRYNTYTAYWQRICREIEEGTYKRHLQRAKKKFGDVEHVVDGPLSAAPAAKILEPGRTASGSYELSLDDVMEDEPQLEEVVDEPPTKPAAPRIPLLATPAALGKWRKVDAKPKEEPAPQKAAEPAPAPPRAAPVVTRPATFMKAAIPNPTITEKAQPKPAQPAITPAASAQPKPIPAPQMTRPAPAAPVAKPAPAQPAPKPAPKPGDLSDDRMRQIYAQYVQTKRAQKESTASVTYENLAKTIQQSTEKLREKHAGRAIDFEVSVKDGKTVLKPVVK